MGERTCIGGLSVSWGCCVSSFCVGHVALGRRDTKGSRQSRQLVARAGWRAVLSGFSDDMASTTIPLFGATLHFDGTTINLDSCGSFGLRDGLGRGAIPVASCRDKRVAAALGPGPGIRHRGHQRDITFPAPPRYASNSCVPCRSKRCLSCQRRTLSGCIQRGSGNLLVEIRLAGYDADRVADGS